LWWNIFQDNCKIRLHYANEKRYPISFEVHYITHKEIEVGCGQCGVVLWCSLLEKSCRLNVYLKINQRIIGFHERSSGFLGGSFSFSKINKNKIMIIHQKHFCIWLIIMVIYQNWVFENLRTLIINPKKLSYEHILSYNIHRWHTILLYTHKHITFAKAYTNTRVPQLKMSTKRSTVIKFVM
jgi:hypothetical protein